MGVDGRGSGTDSAKDTVSLLAMVRSSMVLSSDVIIMSSSISVTVFIPGSFAAGLTSFL